MRIDTPTTSVIATPSALRDWRTDLLLQAHFHRRTRSVLVPGSTRIHVKDVLTVDDHATRTPLDTTKDHQRRSVRYDALRNRAKVRRSYDRQKMSLRQPKTRSVLYYVRFSALGLY
jgi:hypothetical protein